MKALILAAGYATRMYPLTLNQPKPLLKVGNKPIIEFIIEKLNEIEQIDEIFIVTNDKFHSHFTEWNQQYSSKNPIKILNDGTLTNEDRLGAVGDMAFVVEQENITDHLCVIAGDNLFNFSLKPLANLFAEKQGSVIAGRKATKEEISGTYGNLILDSNNKLINFEEKPQNPKSEIAATALYMFHKEAVQELKKCKEENTKLDNSGDFVKYLLEKTDIHSHILEEDWFDIGNKEQYEAAQREYK